MPSPLVSHRQSLPTLHVRPSRGWLNDPNAVTRHRGRWHVFFQHNPLRAQHASIHWGHVSSPDLVTWTEHPVAFGPVATGPDRGGCWSGSFLAGLDRPAVVYTGVLDGAAGSTVCVRYAEDDDLERWSVPVVVAEQPEGVGVREMRDPYPFLWRGRRYAVLGAGQQDGTPAVLLFSCDDPLAWRYEGVWLDGRDPVAAGVAPAAIWECPQVVRLGDPEAGDPVALVLSLWVEGRLTDVVYLLGVMEGDADDLPRFVPQSGALLDSGPDFYAPQIVDDPPGSPLLFGWVRQEGAPDEAPQDAVAGCLTLPRRLSLRHGRIVVEPDPALVALVGDQVAAPADVPGERLELPLRSRATLRGSVDGYVPQVDLVAGDARTRLDLSGSGAEVWVDGEVAEVYVAGGVPVTLRVPGTTTWALEGELPRCEVSVAELRLPGT